MLPQNPGAQDCLCALQIVFDIKPVFVLRSIDPTAPRRLVDHEFRAPQMVVWVLSRLASIEVCLRVPKIFLGHRWPSKVVEGPVEAATFVV